MNDNTIYTLTALGEHELNCAETTLTRNEIELLVRFDGNTTLGQITQHLPAAAVGRATFAVQRLLNEGLLSVAPLDFSGNSAQTDLTMPTDRQSGAEADRGAASLKQDGYFVSIARKRDKLRRRSPGEKLSAVVVDDEPLLAQFIESYLALEGFDVRLAGNRAEIIAEFSRPPIPSLVLLDVMLPDTDGFAVLAKLRQHPAFHAVPIIMLTAKATREDVLKGLAGGADGYITKPFQPDTLIRAVRAVTCLEEVANDARYTRDPWRNYDTKR